MLAQQDCDVSDEGDEADYASDNVFFAVQEGLALCVELSVVCKVVVALGEESQRCLSVMLSAEGVQ